MQRDRKRVEKPSQRTPASRLKQHKLKPVPILTRAGWNVKKSAGGELAAAVKLFADADDLAAQAVIPLDHVVDLIEGVHDGGVVTPAERLTDLRQGDWILRAAGTWPPGGAAPPRVSDRGRAGAPAECRTSGRLHPTPGAAPPRCAGAADRPGRSAPSGMVSGRPERSEKARTRVRAPSSSRMLDCTWRAMVSRISSGTWRPARSALERRMAMRVSRSGGWISTIRPHSKRERRRSSRVTMALGGRSEEITICLSWLCRVLKVWKNSSWVDSLPAMNWMSSISSTSMRR